jgi:hypothetical protein
VKHGGRVFAKISAFLRKCLAASLGGMTPRAIVLGLLCACYLCAITYFNDFVLRQTFLLGSHLPIAVYGSLMLFLLLLHPLLGKYVKLLALRPREIAIICALTFAVCTIPSAGLGRYLYVTLMMPHQLERREPGYADSGLLEKAPKEMLADPGAERDALPGYVTGLDRPGNPMRPTDIPWAAWTQTLLFWLALIGALWLALVGLSLVIHRQWTRHEFLPYPIAQMTQSLLPATESKESPVLRDRLFYLGLFVVAGIHLVNFAELYFPDHLAKIPLTLKLAPLLKLLPQGFTPGGLITVVLNGKIYFVALGMAYFLSREVSLSLAVAPILWSVFTGLLAGYGVQVYAGHTGSLESFFLFGACVGVVASVVYFGRGFYGRVLLRAVGFKHPPGDSVEVPQYAIFGARAAVFGLLLGTLLLTCTGLDWQLAVMAVAFILVAYVTMSRVLAETGFFFLGIYYSLPALFAAIFGGQALGAQVLVILSLLGTVLTHEPRGAFMPYIVNSLRLLEYQRAPISRVAPWVLVAVVLGFCVSVPLTLYWQYRGGNLNIDEWAVNSAARRMFDEPLEITQQLQAQGTLAEAGSLTGFARFTQMQPEPGYLLCMAVGLGLVLLFYYLRLRFVGWPLHPILFVVWSGWSTAVFAMSFFLGWLIKGLIWHYGGKHTYQRLKPLMLGLVAGELIGAILPMMISTALYFINGQRPLTYIVLPS